MLIIIWLVILGYLLFFWAEHYYLPVFHSPTVLKIRLKKQIGEALFALLFVGIGIYLALTQKEYLYLLNHLLCLFGVLFYFVIRQPQLHIKEKGFVYLFSYFPFSQIETMNLTQNGVLIINQKIQIPFADMTGLEQFQNHLVKQLQEQA